MNYENITEAELRAIQEELNREVNELRAKGKYPEALKLREKVLAIQAAADVKQKERYAEYDRIAAESKEAFMASIQGELAAAVSEAETILGGKG